MYRWKGIFVLKLSLFDKAHTKKQTRSFAVLIALIALVYTAVLTPLQLMITSDVLINGTVLPLIGDLVILLTNYSVYWLSFAYLIYRLYRFDLGQCNNLLAVYAVVALLRYPASQLAVYLMTGFPLLSSFLKDDLVYIIINILLDLLLLALALWAMHGLRYRWNGSTPLLESLPTEKLFDLQKPLMRILFCVAAIPAGFQFLSRLIYDFSNGLPKDLPDLLWMITYYLSDFAFVVVGYLVMQTLLNRLVIKEEEAKISFDASSLL